MYGACSKICIKLQYFPLHWNIHTEFGLAGPQTQQLRTDFCTSLSGRNDKHLNFEEIINQVYFAPGIDIRITSLLRKILPISARDIFNST
jgi:hypothetical protein